MPVTFGFASTEYTQSTFTTKYGEELNISYFNGTDKALDYPEINKYLSATKIGDGSYKYNCFSYALIYDGDTRYLKTAANGADVFNVDVPNKFLGYKNSCYTQVSFNTAQNGDVVLYNITREGTTATDFYGYTHAGIISQKNNSVDNTYVLSKWGKYAIYEHKLLDNPYMGSSYSIDMQNMSPELTMHILISFARFTHSYSASPVIIYPNTYALTPKSYYHKIECSKCGAYHFDIHHYSTVGKDLVCSDCGYVSDIKLQSTEIEK